MSEFPYAFFRPQDEIPTSKKLTSLQLRFADLFWTIERFFSGVPDDRTDLTYRSAADLLDELYNVKEEFEQLKEKWAKLANALRDNPTLDI
jgi:hypothetical protein